MAIYRNNRAEDLLDIFFISAVSSLLAVRFYLAITGYPQIGTGGLHIAHMLYGGIFMLIGFILSLTLMGQKIKRVVAVIGGLGFGIFIDEIGKFITQDNNYFFRPAIGIIYAIFVVLYLTFNFLGRRTRMQSREYQINALAELEEAISQGMDRREKAYARMMLSRADQTSYMTIELQKLLQGMETIPVSSPSRVRRILKKIDNLYQKFWAQRNSRTIVKVFFVAEVLLIFVGVLATTITDIDDLLDLVRGRIDYGTGLLIGEISSAFVASALAIYGAYKLKSSRLEAYEYFRRATLINLYLTEFFAFSRVEFAALPGFLVNVGLIILINYAITQEKNLQK